eukprot:NODE_151_length_15465_cov_0.405376.p1 type:complete len:1636 gc:universal NODE_151_length_15465_cov_0.405376:73-4980(+)
MTQGDESFLTAKAKSIVDGIFDADLSEDLTQLFITNLKIPKGTISDHLKGILAAESEKTNMYTIKRCVFAKNTTVLEIVIPKKNIKYIAKAIEKLAKDPKAKRIFQKAKLRDQSRYYKFINSLSNDEKIKEKKRLQSAIYDISFSIQESKSDYRFHSHVSECLLDAICIMFPGYDKVTFRGKVKAFVDKQMKKSKRRIKFKENVEIDEDDDLVDDFDDLKCAFGISDDDSTSGSSFDFDAMSNGNQTNQSDDNISLSLSEPKLQQKVPTVPPAPKCVPYTVTVVHNNVLKQLPLTDQMSVAQLLNDMVDIEFVYYNMKLLTNWNVQLEHNCLVYVVTEPVKMQAVTYLMDGKSHDLNYPFQTPFEFMVTPLIMSCPTTLDISVNGIKFNGVNAPRNGILLIEINSVKTIQSYSVFFQHFSNKLKCVEITDGHSLFDFVRENMANEKLFDLNGVLQLKDCKLNVNDTIMVTGKSRGGSRSGTINISAKMPVVGNHRIEPGGTDDNWNESHYYLRTRKYTNIHRNFRCFDDDVGPEIFEIGDSIRIGYYNCDGLRTREAFILSEMDRLDINMMFVAECKLKSTVSLPSPFIVQSGCTNDGNYGMALVINSRLHHQGHINVISVRFDHILLKIDSLKICGIYIPSQVVNKTSYFNNLLRIAGKSALFIGDSNVRADPSGINPQVTGFLDFVYEKGLNLIIPNNSDFSYCHYNSPRSSMVDYALIPNTFNGQIEVVASQYSCSNHLPIVMNITMPNSCKDLILGKERKIKTYKFYNKYKKEDGTVVYPSREEYLNLSGARLRSIQIEFHNFVSSGSLNDASNLLSDCLLQVAADCKSIGYTKSRPYLIPEHLKKYKDSFTNPQLVSSDQNHFKEYYKNQNAALKANSSKRDELDSCELLKMAKTAKHFKFEKKTMLDFTEIEPMAEKLVHKKWIQSVDEDFTSVLPTDFQSDCFPISVSEVETHLNLMPKNKSCGTDKLPIELIKFGDPLIIEMINSSRNIIDHRHLGLTSHVKKLLEKIFKSRYFSCFETSKSQYGYKPKCSYLDAVKDLDEAQKRLNKLSPTYCTKKYDIRGAFDSVSRLQICNLIDQVVPNKVDAHLMKLMVVHQNVTLRLGPCYSKVFTTNCGVIQGSVLSPLYFAKLIDNLFLDLRTKKRYFGIFADDMVAHEQEQNILELDKTIETRLKTVNLELNIKKCQTLTKRSTYLGINVSGKGLNRDSQIETNIKNANSAKHKNSTIGAFRGALNESNLLVIYQATVIPHYEKGLALFKPIKKIANRINSLILKDIRDLTGASRTMNNKMIYTILKCDHFYYRWNQIYYAFSNHNIQRNELPYNQIQHFDKISYSLRPTTVYYNIKKTSPAILKVLKLQFPPIKLNDCILCHGSHSSSNVYKNQHSIVNCVMKHFIKAPNNDPTQQTMQISLDVSLLNYSIKNDQFVQEYYANDHLQQFIYTDASSLDCKSTGCIFDCKTNQIRMIKLDNLFITSSTRAEVACIVNAIKMFKKSGHQMHIFTDSKSAISEINAFYNHADFRTIKNLDLISQCNYEDIHLHWVKGHLEKADPMFSRGNQICDLGASLAHSKMVPNGVIFQNVSQSFLEYHDSRVKNQSTTVNQFANSIRHATEDQVKQFHSFYSTLFRI